MEIEIKLAPLAEEAAAAVFCDFALLPGEDPGRDIRMETTYFDDPEGFFRRHRMTLRLRRENDVSICTFKTALDGLSRLELEAPAATIQAGARELLAQEALPGEVRTALMGGRFVPVCGARFTRKTRRCAVEHTVFDLCFDQGILFCGAQSEPLCEIELELVEGDPALLQETARRLMAAYGVPLCACSKQQRALALGQAL